MQTACAFHASLCTIRPDLKFISPLIKFMEILAYSSRLNSRNNTVMTLGVAIRLGVLNC